MAVFILLGLEEDAICKISIGTKRQFKVNIGVRDLKVSHRLEIRQFHNI